MTVYRNYVPSERLEFFTNGQRGHNFTYRAINLKAVIIYKRSQMVQLVMGSIHSCFPYLAFFQFAIP